MILYSVLMLFCIILACHVAGFLCRWWESLSCMGPYKNRVFTLMLRWKCFPLVSAVESFRFCFSVVNVKWVCKRKMTLKGRDGRRVI